MKKSLLYAGMLLAASFGLNACSSSDDVTPDGGTKGEQQYVTVNVRQVATTPTSKAQTYESGNEDESKLGVVRFYFFDANGNPFQMQDYNNITSGSTTVNNYVEHDFTNEEQETGDPVVAGSTIERRTSALLVLNGVNGGAPASVIAIANPDQIALLGDGEKQQGDLIATGLTTTNYANDDNTNFVMSSSVYAEAGNLMCAASTTGKVFSSAAAATTNPVEIYIERVAAKVEMDKAADNWITVTLNGESYPAYKVRTLNTTDVDDEGKNLGTSTEKQVYAVVLGWGLADELNTAYAIKHITQSNVSVWNNAPANIMGNTTTNGPWSSADYHRSFWEETPTMNDANRKSQSWNDYTGTDATQFGGVIYTMPNTVQSGISIQDANRSGQFTDRTKVLVAAQLCTVDASNVATPLEICNDQATGQTYASLNDMKNAILYALSADDMIWKSTDGTQFDEIDGNELQFVEQNTNANTVAGAKDYEVAARFVQQEGYTYYRHTGTGTEPSDYTALTTTELENLNNATSGFPSRKAIIYNQGRTYYYTTIQHLAATEPTTSDYTTQGANPQLTTAWLTTTRPMGWFGVVRNHWYKVTLNSLTGLGTAVFNPDRVIRPVTPTNSLTYMAARINVLQWRVVEQTVDINGTPVYN